MSKGILFASLLAVLAVGAMLVGCSRQEPGQEPSGTDQPAPSQPATMGHEGHAHPGSGQTTQGPGESRGAEPSDPAPHSEYEKALAQLAPADRALAEKQKTCPVTGHALGAMGKPHKVTIHGREIFLCCPGCESQIQEDPERYLAKRGT